MRLTTLASAVVLTLSGAALAQVASSPAEQKVPAGTDQSGNDVAVAANEAGPPDATGTGTPSSANAMTQAPDGDPGSATSAPPRKR